MGKLSFKTFVKKGHWLPTAFANKENSLQIMENNLEKVIEENQISTDETLAKRKMFLRKQSRLSGQFNPYWQILENFFKKLAVRRVSWEIFHILLTYNLIF